MRILMLKTAAGPEGVWLEGSVQDLTTEQARRFCAAGAASALEQPEPISAPTPVAEPEPAVEPPVKKKGTRGRR